MTPTTTTLQEQTLIDLGFTRRDTTPEQTGSVNPWYYYELEIGDLSLISCDNEDAVRFGWTVHIFDMEFCIVSDSDLIELVGILKKIKNKQNK
jgi:hypothetical protein